ncbi:rhodanese-like domain-containing protein [Catellatospora sichuanensis]|uniref:rhodanese-like domain-containing protein n=1 Tax=Catellatospora sichuanensis TaxID=1969805 RepID=UPI001182297A|nr:rhodanese-like domain-containing protein [Catellatospora sichuanensis]
MNNTAVPDSRILGNPPAEPSAAVEYFYTMKLRCETDPYDVQHDLAAGAGGFVVIDTRRAAAFDAEHITGARHFPHDEMTVAAMADLDPALVYVTYGWGPGCNGGTIGAAKLAGQGFRVKEMIGGIEYWKRAGYPTRCSDPAGQ